MPGSRTIFVANLPYDVSEEQLGNVFSEVGPVNSVEIKFDPQTGRSKGYAFVQYLDEATAASAVRNLQDVPVNGRNLRVETSDDSKAEGGGMGGGPGGRRGQGGGAGRGRGVGGPGGDRRSADIGPGGPGGPGGPYFDRSRGGRSPPPMGMGMGGPPGGGGYGRGPGGPDGHPPFPPSMGGPMNPGMGGPMGGIDSKPPIDMNALPPGQDVPPGQKATDIISKTLAAITPGQMQDVMMGMKTLVSTQPDQARLLLQSKPQLAYALFQAMLLMNIVDASVLQRIQPVSNTQFPPAPAPGPPAAYPPYPPQNQPAPSYPPYNRAPVDPRQPPHQAQGYNAPPFPPRAAPGPVMPASIPPHAQAALATLPEDQRTMLIQVLQLTPDQVNALDATQKASIVQLRQQFLGTA